MNHPVLIPILALMLAGTAVAQQVTVASSGTRITDTRPGTGAVAEAGNMVAVHYTGWLSIDGAKGRQFDSSRDAGQPFIFRLGAGDVILGWDEGVAGMRVGGRRTLVVPPQAGYGDAGAGDAIPPGSTLIFEVELLAVAP
ncbi:FKBP-type peptidyl-prolyl cis-trans isomerase [Sandarakinorhabdus rubra]|uniref:FKBP-type peptidyl-prolyl cis-trans isomerase n=1 Tax=Sandarakinorhabdus rubra TaxID=2672568 RepID=UPI0013DB4EDF|nr:FKBP-type peptidyl-prolyl cis-trans isomerase [Sandarakinorhabdus rubra]